MSINRPNLNLKLHSKEFVRHYWLKDELLDFCRKVGLSTQGGKIDLSNRIELFLSTGERQTPKNIHRNTKAKMPDSFSRATIITDGFRCTQALRLFFETEIGPSFHFNGIMREFIANKIGSSLGDAIKAYLESVSNPLPKKIAPQFEYNQHIRDFFEKNPNGSLNEAIQAWKKKRTKPNR